MVVEATTVYLVNAVILAVGWILVAGLAVRQSGALRRIALVGSVPALAMSAAYLLMSLEVATYQTAGREQSVMRFFGYTAALLSISYLLNRTIDIPRRRLVVLTAALVLTPWVSFVSWFFTGTIESVLTVFSLVLYVYASYLLVGPLDRLAGRIGGGRRLLFAKLRNLFVLCYGTLVLTSAASEQVLGLLTTFVATIAAGYTDSVLMIGTGLLVLSSVSVFATAAENKTSDQSGEQSTVAAVDTGD